VSAKSCALDREPQAIGSLPKPAMLPASRAAAWRCS
jgi:hypothetical protein